MLQISYNISSKLKDLLQKVEGQRRTILLTPLPRKTELRLRWKAIISRIYWSLSLSENSLTKSEIVYSLTSFSKKKPGKAESHIIGYKKTLDYILHDWFVNTKPVTPETVQYIHQLSYPGKHTGSELRLKELLDYIQTNPENPIIQAAIIQIELLSLSPFTDGNESTSKLLSYVFLYKNGYDFRGLLVLEKYCRESVVSFKENVETCLRSGNLTLWLEYFIYAISQQLTEVIQQLSSKESYTDLPFSFWELNDRQKEILSVLQQPEATITNRKVQQMFKISQITASRDLAKLASLGILFPQGKGRSVYYIRF